MRRIVFAIVLFASSLAHAQQRDDKLLDDLDRVRTFNAVAISPDGRHVAWSVQGIGVTTATTGGMDVHLLPGDGDDHYVAWSPDSRSIATVSDGGKNQVSENPRFSGEKSPTLLREPRESLARSTGSLARSPPVSREKHRGSCEKP